MKDKVIKPLSNFKDLERLTRSDRGYIGQQRYNTWIQANKPRALTRRSQKKRVGKQWSTEFWTQPRHPQSYQRSSMNIENFNTPDMTQHGFLSRYDATDDHPIGFNTQPLSSNPIKLYDDQMGSSNHIARKASGCKSKFISTEDLLIAREVYASGAHIAPYGEKRSLFQNTADCANGKPAFNRIVTGK